MVESDSLHDRPFQVQDSHCGQHRQSRPDLSLVPRMSLALDFWSGRVYVPEEVQVVISPYEFACGGLEGMHVGPCASP
jgi:hypothetical protein